MRFQDYIIDSIQKGFDEAFKSARAVPEDKLGWRPLDNGRSVIDQLQELAQSPDYVTGLVRGEKPPEMSEDSWKKVVEERQGWATIDQCEAIAKERLANFFAAVREVSDQRLSETVWLPYDGGRDFTIQEVIEYPRWNANYHSGQIAYIQTLYGDKEMH